MTSPAQTESAQSGDAPDTSTRGHLLDVAARRFAEGGYDATSFSDLVASSGLSRGAFYFHFDSKRDLAVNVFRDRQSRLRQQIMERIDPELSPLDRFRQLWVERARIVAGDPSLRCLRKLGAALSEDPDMQDELTEFHAGPVRIMAEMIAQAQQVGDVRQEVDPVEFAETAFALIVGLDEVSDRESDSEDLVERAEASLDALLHGITRP